MRKIRFSSDNLKHIANPHVKARAWTENLLAGGYNGEPVAFSTDNGFYGEVELSIRNEIMISHSRANSMILQRRHEHIAKEYRNKIMLFLNNGNQKLQATQLKRNMTLNKNQAVLLSAEFPQILDGRHSGDVLCMILPDSIFERWGEPVEDYLNLNNDYKSPIFRMINAYCKMLHQDNDVLSNEEVYFLCNHISDLFALWFGIRNIDIDEISSNCARFIAIKRIIRNNLYNTEFNIHDAAHILGISTRLVQHVLTKNQTNFHTLLNKTRAKIAFCLLNDDNAKRYGIENIALHCGFGDYSKFYRSFKYYHKASPKEFLI